MPMHAHPDYVAVNLTDSHQKITDADGKINDVTRKAGDAAFTPSLKHAEENMSDKPFEVVIVELK